jgi:hypothetical protein
MTTRKQLEEILAAQRVQRAHSPISPLHKRGRDLVGALAVIAILVVSGAAMFFAINMTTPKTDGTVAPSASTMEAPSATATTIMATPVAMMVCTDIPDGRLHVRFVAGEGSEVRGYLAEGETVQVALISNNEINSQIIQGELWLRISSPIAGWVNARYLCKSK